MSGDKKRKLLEGWKWSSLGNNSLVTLIMGQSPPGETYNKNGTGLPFFQGKADFGNMHPKPSVWCSSPNRLAESNDILMSVRAPVGPTNIAEERCCIGRGIAAIRCKEGLSYKYLIWVLRNFENKISSAGSGSIFDAIGKDEIKAIEFPIPPTPAGQLAIASELERRMAHVDKMRGAALRQKEAIAAMQGAILREAFPYEEGDELPEGWRWEELGNLFKIEKQQIDPFDESFYSLRFIGMENIESNTRKFIPNGNTEESGDSTCLLFDNKHVLYGKLRPYLNKVYLPDKKGRCSTELIPLIPKNDFSRSFIASVLQSEIVVNYAVKHSTGGRMPRADMEKLKKLKVPLPSNSNTSAAELERKMAELEKARQAAQRQVEAIEALPGAILREVFDFEEENTGS